MRPAQRCRGWLASSCAAVATLLAGCPMASLTAQTLAMFPPPGARPSIELRYLHILPNKQSSGFENGTLDMTVDVPAGNRITLVVSLPVTHDSSNVGGATFFGNVFLGVQLAGDSAATTAATLGMYLPTASSASTPIPLYLNRYEMQRYVHGYTTTYLNVGAIIFRGRDYHFRGEVGTAWFAASQRADTSTIVVHYGLAANVGSPDIRFVFELTGLVNFTDSFLGLRDRFLNFVNVGAVYTGSFIRPGVLIQLPMNRSLLSLVDGAIGVKLGVVI